MTYNLWKEYYYDEWKHEYDLSINEIAYKLAKGFCILLITPISLLFDIFLIPFYIIAFIIWFMRGCE